MRSARIRAGLVLGVLMLASSSTRAGEVDLSVETRLGGDSNVFRRENDRTEDAVWELAPRLRVHELSEMLDYDFDYRPNYRNFLKTEGIDGVDHSAHGRFNWAPNGSDRVSASGSYFNGRQFLFGRNESSAIPSFDVNDRERIRISDAQFSYEHMLSRSLSAEFSGFFDDFDASGTSERSQTDSRAYTGQVGLNQAITPLTQVGLLLSARRRENRATGLFRPSSKTDVWDLMITASRRLTPSLVVSAQIGPSFIRQQQFPGGAYVETVTCTDTPGFENFSDCTRFPKDESSDVTLFASASLKKDWKTSDLSLSYVRSEARSGNVTSASSIADRVQLVINRRISDRLKVRARGAFDRLEQIFGGQGSNGQFTLTIGRATGTVEFAMSSHWYLVGNYTYTHQIYDRSNQDLLSSGGQAATRSDVQIHVGYAGVRYSFDSIKF